MPNRPAKERSERDRTTTGEPTGASPDSRGASRSYTPSSLVLHEGVDPQVFPSRNRSARITLPSVSGDEARAIVRRGDQWLVGHEPAQVLHGNGSDAFTALAE